MQILDQICFKIFHLHIIKHHERFCKWDSMWNILKLVWSKNCFFDWYSEKQTERHKCISHAKKKKKKKKKKWQKIYHQLRLNCNILHSVSAPNLKLPLAGFTSVSPPNNFLLTGVWIPSGLLTLVDNGVEDVTVSPINVKEMKFIEQNMSLMYTKLS